MGDFDRAALILFVFVYSFRKNIFKSQNYAECVVIATNLIFHKQLSNKPVHRHFTSLRVPFTPKLNFDLY